MKIFTLQFYFNFKLQLLLLLLFFFTSFFFSPFDGSAPVAQLVGHLHGKREVGIQIDNFYVVVFLYDEICDHFMKNENKSS